MFSTMTKSGQPPHLANYQFAAKEALASIVLAEVIHVGSWMPVVFIEEAGRYVLMAMMSSMPGHNLFVGPDGEWLGGYARRLR
jgi:hypothetical protein